MKSHKKTAAIALAAVALVMTMPMCARADASAGVVWAANPAGVQTMPDAQALALLPSSGYVPLQSSGGKCLLVARRGTQIVAIELSPLIVGAKVVGWTPQTIDMSTLTSKWGYQAPKSSIDMKSFGNPVTNSFASASSSASSWSNGNVDAHSSAIASTNGETEAAESVTVNGKTYRKYSHFKPATADAPVAASDEYFCQ